MALPTLQSASYTTTIPSTGKPVTYRPFLVKEEKILLMAQESKDDRNTFRAMKDLITACTFEKVDPNKLTTYDLEFLFLKIRARSVGETATIRIPCQNEHANGPGLACSHAQEATINLDEIGVVWPENTDNNFILTDNGVGVTMRHMLVEHVEHLAFNKSSAVQTMGDIIIAHIESIFDAEKVYPASESTREELEQFINSMSRQQIAILEGYIARAPKLEKKMKWKCPHCGHDNDVTLSGIQDFFG